MKIILPNGERLNLDNKLPLDQKKKKVVELSEEWHELCSENWEMDNVIYFLDGLANYLCWHKEPEKPKAGEKKPKKKQDKKVFSVYKIEQMNGRRKAISIPFSSLPTYKKELLGVEVRYDD